MLVVADVDYGDQDADIGQPQHGLKQLRWPRLGASRRELEAIANSLGDREITALTGCDASTTAVAEALGRVRLAHFATHGFFLDDPLTDALRLAANEHSTSQLQINSSRASFLARSPFLRSGLALAGANRPAALGADGLPRMAEGILTAEAVASLDAEQLDLVVLSACDTTRGDLATGDGVLGIQNAFHIGGARNVISGLWKIPDEAAADLMTEFYRLLAHGSVSPLAALRLAQLQLARQAGLTTGQTRGAELASTVPLPATVAGRVAQWCPGVKRWAGFSLSGPGY
jgi:CHAT domain-containing protein